jgi:hypothetical protein
MSFALWFNLLKSRRNHPIRKPTRHGQTTTRHRVRPRVEALEDRTLPSAYVVTTTADSGPGSLRDAINQINADTSHTLYASPSNPSVDEIDFNITAASDTGGGYNATTGVATITPLSPLGSPPYFNITNSVFIDGYTQGYNPDGTPTPLAASPNTLAQGDNAVLKIQLDLSAISAGAGLNVAASTSTISGLVVNGVSFDGPAIVASGTGDEIQGNFIGTDVTGTQVVGNAGWGVVLFGTNDVVGGTTPAARNIISGNGNSPSVFFQDQGGIQDAGTGDNIQGNYIGTDATGTKALGNGPGFNGSYGWGVSAGGVNGTIGGTAPGAGNLISGNESGILEWGTNNVVEGNLIGTDVTGMSAVPNATGVLLYGGRVGGTTAAARNIISGNGVGIFDAAGPGGQIYGNYIGTDITGTAADGNVTPQNTGIGVILWDDGGTVGGAASGAGNVISGNQYGIRIHANDCQIEGNLIGTDYTGTNPLANGYGIYSTDGSSNSVIGGLDTNAVGTPVAGGGNVISGNTYGVGMFGGSGDVIEGNYIGTDITGTTTTGTNGSTLGNRVDVGISASNTTLGGTSVGSGNIIAGSFVAPGVSVSTSATSSTNGATGVSILGNSIYDNPGGGGILLGPGANNNQAAPVLTAATSSATGTAISGTLAGYPSSAFRIEFFSNPMAGTGEGQTFLGFAQVTTDASGNFTANLPSPLPPGTFLSATATDASGNTSEFAADITVKAALTVVTNSSLMLVGNSPPPLTGSVNGTPFTSPFQYTTPWGDTITITLNTAATSASPVGQYPITASLSGAAASNYVLTLTPGTMYVVSVGADPSSTTGAQAVTFWDNKGNATLITAADLSSLDALSLVNQGGAAFDPKAVAQLQAWLSTSPNATPAYQLAVQLAAMDLNVLSGYVQTTDLVYAGALLPYASAYGISGLTSGGFIDVQDLMAAANAALAQVSPGAASGDPNQAYETALAQVLQAADANSAFVTQELLWGLVGM